MNLDCIKNIAQDVMLMQGIYETGRVLLGYF